MRCSQPPTTWKRVSLAQDPMSPVRAYWNKLRPPDFFFFGSCGADPSPSAQATSSFPIGSLNALFKSAWPQCWRNLPACDEQWVKAVTYHGLFAVKFGQCVVGLAGD
ncbi:hypothetical protein JCM8547_002695 [Rhodosporidiobolus lusitaniae]